MNVKDFSILLEKINTPSSKKDIGIVTGFNAYAQYIESICKTQKGELVSNMNLGTNYYNYIFDGQADVGSLEMVLAAYIESAIPDLHNVRVSMNYFSESVFQFTVYYSVGPLLNKQSNVSTFIEVEL